MQNSTQKYANMQMIQINAKLMKRQLQSHQSSPFLLFLSPVYILPVHFCLNKVVDHEQVLNLYDV